MSMKRQIVLCFFWVVANFVTKNNSEYLYREVKVEGLSLIPTDEYPRGILENSHLAKLSLEERRAICFGAQTHASLPFIIADQFIFEGHVYMIDHLFGIQQTAVTIKCPTVPEVHLCSGRADNEIRILVVQLLPPSSSEKVINYTFDIEFFRNIPSLAAHAAVKNPNPTNIEEKFGRNHLFLLDPEDRFNICFLAARSIWRVFSFNKHQIDLPTVQSVDYRFNNRNISTVKYVVINCGTTPAIYLRAKISNTRGAIGIKIMVSDLDPVITNSNLQLISPSGIPQVPEKQ